MIRARWNGHSESSTRRYGQYRERALARRLELEPFMRYDVVAERMLAAF